MEKKKILTYFVALATVVYLGAPLTYAQTEVTCNPDTLTPVRYGQRSDAVKNVQACLIQAGYDIPAGATGYYGKQTVNAVKKFYAEWYGAWKGYSIGPKGIEKLKTLVAKGAGAGAPTLPSTGGLTREGIIALLKALGVTNPTDEQVNTILAVLSGTAGTTTAPTTPTQPTTGVEGVLTVERNSDPTSNVPLREGETANVLGIRLRATQGDVTVQRIRIDWPTDNVDAPYRILSKVALVDQDGNTLWSADVTSNENQPFYRETSGQYYLLITGLNYVVPKDTVKVIYLKATAVSTYPSGVGRKPIRLTVPQNGVRAVTAGSIDVWGPSDDNTVNNSFLPETTLAQSAQLSVVRTSDTPQETNIIANELVSGTGTKATMRLTQDTPLLKVRLTAQNDSLRLREANATFAVNASTTQPTLFYLMIDGRKVGNVTVNQYNATGTISITDLYPENIVIPSGSYKEAIIGVSRVEGIGYNEATITVTLNTVKAENSLGAVITSSGSATSELVHLFAVAPTFTFQNANVTAARDQNLNTTTLSFTGKIGVTVPTNVHAGGQVKLSDTNPFVLQWEFSNTSTATSVSYTIASVRDSAGNIVTPDPTTNGYVLNAGDTYYFELTAQTVVSKAPQGRVRVNSITWTPGNSNTFDKPSVTSTYVSRDFVTGWSN
jgi:hypothetical protein